MRKDGGDVARTHEEPKRNRKVEATKREEKRRMQENGKYMK